MNKDQVPEEREEHVSQKLRMMEEGETSKKRSRGRPKKIYEIDPMSVPNQTESNLCDRILDREEHDLDKLNSKFEKNFNEIEALVGSTLSHHSEVNTNCMIKKYKKLLAASQTKIDNLQNENRQIKNKLLLVQAKLQGVRFSVCLKT